MIGTGRAIVRAPKGSRVSATSMGTGDNLATSFYSGGDTTLTAALAAGATSSTSATIVSNTGFVAATTVVFGPGSDREESLTLHATIASGGATDLKIADSQTVKNDHPIGERVVTVNANAPIRPGSVTITVNSNTVAHDDGAGNLVETGTPQVPDGNIDATTSSIDYVHGIIKSEWSDAPNTGAVSYACETMPAEANINDFDGDGFFKNTLAHKLNRRDIPDEIVVHNLGDSEVGVTIEKSRNDGKGFVKGGQTVKLPARGRKVITPDGGIAPSLDQLRVRASSAQDTVDTSDGSRTANANEASTVEVNMLYTKLDNGQA